MATGSVGSAADAEAPAPAEPAAFETAAEPTEAEEKGAALATMPVPEDVGADDSVAVPVSENEDDAATAIEDDDVSPAAADAADHAPDPRPLFSELGLSEPIVRAVEEKGYLHPTPIQAQAIPYVLMGRDVLGVAQTGTGKTAGFTLPLLEILSDSRSRARMPRSLILEPTRELALQVAENFVDYGRHLKLNHALLIGGESMADQKEALARGVDVLIATPGRLLDLFERGGLLLNDTRILVIDEADRMLDMGFIPDVERIVSLVSPMRQTLFFSATMAPEIRRLADAFLRNPKEISVTRAASVANTIEAGLALVDESEKRRALRALVRGSNVSNALIFCNRKRDVDVLSRSLLKHGFSAGALHGDLAQSVRFATLERFKAGEIQLLVCSDVAARGIDIGGLSHVFNFDVPIHSEDYVHRIGRTGRAGRSGHALTIAGPEDRLLVDGIERLIGAPIPRVAIDGVATAEWAATDGTRRRRGASGRGRAERGGVRSDRSESARPDRGGRRDRVGRGERPGERPSDRAAVRSGDGASERGATTEAAGSARHAAAGRDDQRTPREANGRDSHTRGGNGRDGPGRGFRREDPPARGDGRRDNGRWRGAEDLGPSVLGFGDLVPDFMQLPRRARDGANGAEIGRPDVEHNSAPEIDGDDGDRVGSETVLPTANSTTPGSPTVVAIPVRASAPPSPQSSHALPTVRPDLDAAALIVPQEQTASPAGDDEPTTPVPGQTAQAADASSAAPELDVDRNASPASAPAVGDTHAEPNHDD